LAFTPVASEAVTMNMVVARQKLPTRHKINISTKHYNYSCCHYHHHHQKDKTDKLVRKSKVIPKIRGTDLHFSSS